MRKKFKSVGRTKEGRVGKQGVEVMMVYSHGCAQVIEGKLRYLWTWRAIYTDGKEIITDEGSALKWFERHQKEEIKKRIK